MFLNSINHFRAIAVIFIVAGHCFPLANYAIESNLSKLFLTLVGGGASFFVFISGFLFQHLFKETFDYKKYLKKKANYLLVPYIILSFFPVLIFIYLDHYPNTYLEPTKEGWFFQNIVPFLKSYFTGFHIAAYWYIPFALILFSLTPVFINFMKLRTNIQILIITLWFILSAFMHRPFEESIFSIIQAAIYFIPMFLFGMLISKHRNIVYSKLSGREIYLFITVLILVFFQVYIGRHGSYFKRPLDFNGIDLMLIQKIIFIVFFIVFLYRFNNKESKIINIIASNSFGIFFFHGIWLLILNKLKDYLPYNLPVNNFGLLILTIIMVFSISLLSSFLVRKIIPRQSRYIIGN